MKLAVILEWLLTHAVLVLVGDPVVVALLRLLVVVVAVALSLLLLAVAVLLGQPDRHLKQT